MWSPTAVLCSGAPGRLGLSDPRGAAPWPRGGPRPPAPGLTLLSEGVAEGGAPSATGRASWSSHTRRPGPLRVRDTESGPRPLSGQDRRAGAETLCRAREGPDPRASACAHLCCGDPRALHWVQPPGACLPQPPTTSSPASRALSRPRPASRTPPGAIPSSLQSGLRVMGPPTRCWEPPYPAPLSAEWLLYPPNWSV